MAWLKSILSILFFLLIESFLVGFIVFILISNIPILSIVGLTYLQLVCGVWVVKLLLNNVFALATHNVSDEELGIVDENIIDENKLA